MVVVCLLNVVFVKVSEFGWCFLVNVIFVKVNKFGWCMFSECNFCHL